MDPLTIATLTLCLGVQTAALLIGFALLTQQRYHVAALNGTIRDLAAIIERRTGESVAVPAPLLPDADATLPPLPEGLNDLFSFRAPKPWGVR